MHQLLNTLLLCPFRIAEQTSKSRHNLFSRRLETKRPYLEISGRAHFLRPREIGRYHAYWNRRNHIEKSTQQPFWRALPDGLGG